MNYRTRAYFLGSLFVVAGMLVLTYSLAEAKTFTTAVEGSIIVFMALGLLLIGTLILFAAPESLLPSEIVSRALEPIIGNQSLILDSLIPDDKAFHIPKFILGGESTVYLVFVDESELSTLAKERQMGDSRSTFGRTRKVLVPTGMSLMQGYEKSLQRDFLELDTQQLARLLGKVIVPELQLASGFSLSELPANRVEAIWNKPTISHSCLGVEGKRHPELCYLCSSIACALAKATGKVVMIEGSNQAKDSSAVSTIYQILSP